MIMMNGGSGGDDDNVDVKSEAGWPIEGIDSMG
jgi:hypothetical protein